MLNSNFSSLHFHSTILLETNHHLLTCLSRKALTLLYSWQPFLLLFSLLHGEGDGTPLQYSCLENPMDGGAWWASVHGVMRSRKLLSDFTFTHWKRKWCPTPGLLPEKSCRQRSLVGFSPWGLKELDRTEHTCNVTHY